MIAANLIDKQELHEFIRISQIESGANYSSCSGKISMHLTFKNS